MAVFIAGPWESRPARRPPRSSAVPRGHVDANKMGFTSLEFFITSGQSELLEVQLIGEKDHTVYYDQVITGEDFFETPYPGRASVSLNAADAIGLEGGYFPDIQYILYITNADTERPLEIEVLQDANGTRTPHIFLHRDSYNGYRFAVAVILFVFVDASTLIIYFTIAKQLLGL